MENVMITSISVSELEALFKKVLKDVLNDNLDKSRESKKDGQYLTIEQAAEFLKVKKSTLYQYTSRGQIEHFKIGGRLLFKKEMLEQFIGKGRIPILKSGVF